MKGVVRLPPHQPIELLAVLADERPMQTLIAQLRETGFNVDTAHDLESARKLFFGSGGHHCVVMGPDVTPGTAGAVVDSLREVDPELPAVTFGPRLCRETAPSRTTTLVFHPGSRAGVGALLRFLQNLPERE